MRPRAELHEILKQIPGSKYVYFQPPESVKMKYPCIVYSMDDIDTKAADNISYVNTKRYSVTIIDKDPDSMIPEALLKLPMCSFDRSYTIDNLNHWVLRLYF